MTPPPDANWIILVPVLLACGMVAGLLAGLLGVGGGIVIVPVLYHVFAAEGLALDVTMPLAVGTSLASIVLTSMMSARAHHRHGTVDGALLRAWAPGILAGVVAGTWLGGAVVSGALLKTLFGIMLLAVSAHMLLTARSRPTASDVLPGRHTQRGVSFGIGGLAAMLGIGGGTLAVPVLNLFAFPIHRAVGTSAVFGFLISVPAAVGYVIAGWGSVGLPAFSTGYVNWLAFVLLVPATMLFAPIGVRLCHRLDVTRLRQVFAVFILLVGMEMTLF
jgi:uncharacterized protein